MSRVRIFLSVILTFMLAGQAFAGQKLPGSIVLSPAVLHETRQRVFDLDPALMPAYDALIKDADRAINAPAEAVILKATPGPSGDLHDYWSLSPY